MVAVRKHKWCKYFKPFLASRKNFYFLAYLLFKFTFYESNIHFIFCLKKDFIIEREFFSLIYKVGYLHIVKNYSRHKIFTARTVMAFNDTSIPDITKAPS